MTLRQSSSSACRTSPKSDAEFSMYSVSFAEVRRIPGWRLLLNGGYSLLSAEPTTRSPAFDTIKRVYLSGSPIRPAAALSKNICG
jgi:hypothetical protein